MKCEKLPNARRLRPEIRSSARGAPRRPAGTPKRTLCEGLECRLLLSKVGAIVDAGDSYFNYTNQAQESLYRATDRVTVGLFPSSARRRSRLESALTADTGPLVGYRILKQLTDTSVILERTARGPAPSLDKLQARISGFPNLKYLSPTFFYSDWTRTEIYDQIYVDLRADVDPAQFFAKGYAEVIPATGVNAFNVTLRRGGGLDVLRVAAKLRMSPLVQVAEPDSTITLVASSSTFTGPA
jgi:hypothetical protein